MAPGKDSRPAATRARSSGERSAEQQANIIVAQRDRLIVQIRLLREGGAASRLTDNAEQLLTRWWSRANWHGREELLNTAEWLLRIADRQSRPTSSGATNVAKHRRRARPG